MNGHGIQGYGLRYTISTKTSIGIHRTDHHIPKIANAGSEYWASIMVVGVGPSVGGPEYFTLGIGTGRCCSDTQLLSFFVLAKTLSFEC